jgi:hypothetical protein
MRKTFLETLAEARAKEGDLQQETILKQLAQNQQWSQGQFRLGFCCRCNLS